MKSINAQRFGLCAWIVTGAVITIGPWYSVHETRADPGGVLEEPLFDPERGTTDTRGSGRESGPTAPTEPSPVLAQAAGGADAGDEQSADSTNVEQTKSAPEQPPYYLGPAPPEETDSSLEIRPDVPNDALLTLVQAVRLQRLPLLSLESHLILAQAAPLMLARAADAMNANDTQAQAHEDTEKRQPEGLPPREFLQLNRMHRFSRETGLLLTDDAARPDRTANGQR